MSQKMIRVGIVGGAGYTAGELMRILINHPYARIAAVTSTSNAGNPVYKVHDDLNGLTDLVFSDNLKGDEDLVFLCLGHGNSKAFFEGNVAAQAKIIDMSNDFRLNENQEFAGRHFVYGLPELQREAIKKANNIANPGCFATAIQLALLPLAEKGQIESDVHVSAITGSTGAGRSLSDTVHFSWRNNNASIYKVFTHQHLGEIKQSLHQLQNSFDKNVWFVPYRGNFTRGIFASCYTPYSGSLDNAIADYKNYYQDHPFVQVSDEVVHLKQVVGTNRCLLHLQMENGMLLISSVIDNLVKGASGQAVQNMNLMWELPEETGLKLRSLAF